MLKKNIFANTFAQVWTTLIGVVFIPRYINYLGVESYGLIALFTLLYTWLSILNMGISPTINREMGRMTGQGDNVSYIHDLLRSLEIIVFCIAAFCVLLVCSGAFWLASHWLNYENLSVSVVETAIQLIGIVIGLRFFEDVYRSALIGLQKQVLYSLVNSLLATLRAGGVLFVLAFVSATIEAFFLWQMAMSLLSIAIYGFFTYRYLPVKEKNARFSMHEIRRVKSFALGMLGITVMATLLTQFDKVILTRMLTLTDYGYYALASLVASLILVVSQPVSQALFPRLNQLFEKKAELDVINLFHLGSQVISVLLGCFAGILIIYTDFILDLWMDDPALVKETSLLVKILVFGNLANGLMSMPYHMQLVHGWTRLSFYINLFSLVLLVPLMLWFVPLYGAVAAASIWVALNLGYMIISPYFMHRRILKGEKGRWYLDDVVMPVAAAFASAILLRYFTFSTSSEILQYVFFFISTVLIFSASALAAPMVRSTIFSYLRAHA